MVMYFPFVGSGKIVIYLLFLFFFFPFCFFYDAQYEYMLRHNWTPNMDDNLSKRNTRIIVWLLMHWWLFNVDEKQDERLELENRKDWLGWSGMAGRRQENNKVWIICAPFEIFEKLQCCQIKVLKIWTLASGLAFLPFTIILTIWVISWVIYINFYVGGFL